MGRLDDENAAPSFARRGDQGLLFYSAEGRWQTRVVGADGAPAESASLDVGPSADAAMPSLKPSGDGYVAVWVDKVAKNHAVKLLELDAHGKPRSAPLLVTQIAGEASWVDVLPNAHGVLVLWEIAHDDRSDVSVVAVSGGKVSGAPTLVAHNAIGWEALATERGAALALVLSGPVASGAPKPRRKGRPAAEAAAAAPMEEPADPRGSKVGRVLLTELDALGKPGALVEVSAEPTAQVDVELVEIAGKYVLAWSDERNIDSAIYAAAVQPGGNVTTPPHQVTPPFGEQALVALVATPYAPSAAGGKRALLAWEDQLKAPRDGRLIHLATLGPDATLGKERTTLTFSASGPPDLVADGEGFAALTLAPASRDMTQKEIAKEEAKPAAPASDAPLPKRADAPVWPSFVRMGADLRVLAAEPIRADAFTAGEGIPYLTRNLSCGAGICTAIASGTGTGAPLAVVTLPIRKSVWRSPAWREPEDSLPRPAAVTALFDGDHIANVAAAELPGGRSLAAWVTYYLEGAQNAAAKRTKGGKPDDQESLATLGVRPIGADGAPGKAVILSHRAVSIGGVSMAASLPDPRGEKKTETAVAWVARDKNEAQVFVTKVGPDGTKLAQKGVTTVARKKRAGTPSEASDVAIVADADGWIVAWSDTRDGNSEIYIAKLDRNLNKVIPDRRITEAPGDSAEVQLAVHGKDLILTWSDARQSPEEGTGDIYVARLEASTLKKLAPETRVFASALHSRTPQLTATTGGYVLSWIEDAFGEGKAEAAAFNAERGVRVARLNDKGEIQGPPQLVRMEGQAAVTSSALECKGDVCRGVITSAIGEGLVLAAFELRPDGGAGPIKTLASLTGAVTEDVSPTFAGPSATSLFFADDSVSGSGRVRLMTLAWP